MRILGLDVGKRRTGVAFAETALGIVMALDTIKHMNTDELITILIPIIKEKRVDELAIGLPRLLDGTEGEQATYVREVADIVSDSFHLPVHFIDERFSSYGTTKENADTKAACSIVEMAMANLS